MATVAKEPVSAKFSLLGSNVQSCSNSLIKALGHKSFLETDFTSHYVFSEKHHA